MQVTPKIIAGPCSAESREQVLSTAKQLASGRIDFFRSGIWKPRTRPGAFEGAGNVALDWMLEARDKYGLKICTEVANPEHVEAVLKKGFDMVWVGARSTANPFTVQEISESLKGVDIPVMIKNPTNPDLKLWIGAVERFQNNGIRDISVIHRGFSVYEKQRYRNNPNWQIALDLKKELPNMPLLCDPSHISGRRHLIFDISQKAMDLHYDGLMIETHCNPDKALTDSKQQISPKELFELLEKLKLRSRGEFMDDQLREFRLELNEIDRNLIDLLKKRMDISEQIGSYKKDLNRIIFQKSIWEKAFMDNVNNALDVNLSEEFASQLFKLIHQESIVKQSKIFLNPDEED
ncbi:MAG: bifunctional 3-deoxy-7-phosphoheptulonate synthase/chorismate mutase type II [Crocinitomicaceae bacterium]|jgi:chorismate mutase|nr:bifunctional 3-deoxy-7-phosphoheptulonate synthase/chorismate mutase type II [Flavobacteriales bacterium]MDC1244346.1 bifunctional 3-deoxy-7-phosphoheptulonate synthase/chorismate mutase type II [Crocinitomicaceae bacterium]MDC3308606.1 bifunctional 3-deoxy-7-phosphoheptulonate synthase/chorismate mutase type II [Crocinitomicaceae bacterium]MDO7610544.1 bifunctional 3-deoxy-7-phosphoheptulonate synthase/chorismate mutase type II [Crocinitomicaceae bacterium]MDO7614295.1 bifunctional 3-deoxy-